MAYLIVNRTPVVIVQGDDMHIARPTFSWRKTALPLHDVLKIETDWIRDTSHATIVFSVTPGQFAKQ